MIFDKIIMNPPYSRNLHLKVVEKCIRHITENGEVINLAPNFYEDYKHLKDVPVAYNVEVVDRVLAEKLFPGIQLAFNLSIQNYNKSKSDKSLLEKFTPASYKIFSKIKLSKTFKNVNVENYSGESFFVPLKLMTATWDKNKNNIVDSIGVIESGLINGVPFKDLRNRNKDRPCGGISFHSKEEAKNFIEFTQTSFFKCWVYSFHTNSRYLLSEYPYLGEVENPRTHKIGYESDWTNEDLCKVFNITGFISDTEAEAGSEWEEILKT